MHVRYAFLSAGLGYFLYVRRGALLAGASGSFQRFQKFDGGEGGEAPAMQNGTANIYASTGGSRFGNGRMVRSFLLSSYPSKYWMSACWTVLY